MFTKDQWILSLNFSIKLSDTLTVNLGAIFGPDYSKPMFINEFKSDFPKQF